MYVCCRRAHYKHVKIYMGYDYLFCCFCQTLEEPGEDNTKFDNIVPTIVKPKTEKEFHVESALEGNVSVSYFILKALILACISSTLSATHFLLCRREVDRFHFQIISLILMTFLSDYAVIL